MELYHVIFDANLLHVGGVTLLIIGAILFHALAAGLFRLLLQNRIKVAIQQVRINGLPDAIPIAQRAILHIFIGKNAFASLAFYVGQRWAMAMVTVGERLDARKRHA